MTWLIRGMFLMALVLTAAWGYMNMRAANGLRTKLATAVEAGNGNAATARTLKYLLSKSEQENKEIVLRHNEEVGRLFLLSEQNRAAATADAERLLGQAAVWRDRNRSRGSIAQSDVCEQRLLNIDSFLTGYIEEVRDVSR